MKQKKMKQKKNKDAKNVFQYLHSFTPKMGRLFSKQNTGRVENSKRRDKELPDGGFNASLVVFSMSQSKNSDHNLSH